MVVRGTFIEVGTCCLPGHDWPQNPLNKKLGNGRPDMTCPNHKVVPSSEAGAFRYLRIVWPPLSLGLRQGVDESELEFPEGGCGGTED